MKLIATDLDGTLLHSDGNISPFTLNTLRQASDKGANVVIATGRMFAGTSQILRYMPFCRYCITTNGAEIYDRTTDKLIYSRPIEQETALFVANYAKKNNIHMHAYAENVLYTTMLDEKSVLYKKATGLMGTLLEEDFCDFYSKHSIAKLVLIDSRENCDKFFLGLKNTLGKSASIVQSNANFVEITSNLATKGQALNFLIDFLGVLPKQTIAFGDSGNDIPMLSGPWNSRAVANAWTEVKQIADKIIESNNDDGVAKEINRIFSLKGDKQCNF